MDILSLINRMNAMEDQSKETSADIETRIRQGKKTLPYVMETRNMIAKLLEDYEEFITICFSEVELKETRNTVVEAKEENSVEEDTIFQYPVSNNSVCENKTEENKEQNKFETKNIFDMDGGEYIGAEIRGTVKVFTVNQVLGSETLLNELANDGNEWYVMSRISQGLASTTLRVDFTRKMQNFPVNQLTGYDWEKNRIETLWLVNDDPGDVCPDDEECTEANNGIELEFLEEESEEFDIDF